MNIESYLERFKGEKFFYKPNPGNGGDAIIAHATFKVFKKLNLDYEIVDDNSNLKDQHVVYGGGGNFIEKYNECADFIEKSCGKASSITLLPHTVTGNEPLLGSLDERVTIICREEKSFEYVKSFENIKNVLLFNDMAVDHTFADKELRSWCVNRFVFLLKPKDILWNIYYKKKSWDYYLNDRNKTKVLNAFRIDAEKTSIKIPDDNLDVSAIFNYDSSMLNEKLVKKTALTIASFLNQFETINTNRLHICITAAILGKKVNFYSNSYWKNESIYNFSLKNRFPSINWNN